MKFEEANNVLSDILVQIPWTFIAMLVNSAGGGGQNLWEGYTEYCI